MHRASLSHGRCHPVNPHVYGCTLVPKMSQLIGTMYQNFLLTTQGSLHSSISLRILRFLMDKKCFCLFITLGKPYRLLFRFITSSSFNRIAGQLDDTFGINLEDSDASFI